MSGGVDSSVAAALLKDSHFDLVGVFLRLCPSRGSEMRARRVAKVLGIPFRVLNFEKEFKKKVVDYFLRECKKGRTPNPCVVCNKQIKFGLLLEKALGLKGDFVATGHYARKRETKDKTKRAKYKLLRAEDKKKDQSYFLWQLNQRQLKHILFPVGDHTKRRARALAKKFKLPVLNIPESQEICFVRTTINDFLSHYLKTKPGPIVEQAHYGASKIVGQHQGLHFYTIGQRKGIGISGGPWYVSGKDLKRNALIVSKNEKDLTKKELVAEKVNWISGESPKLPSKVKVKIRYKSPLVGATITKKLKGKKYEVVFSKPQRAITPGQSVVFYYGQEVLGGGIIV